MTTEYLSETSSTIAPIRRASPLGLRLTFDSTIETTSPPWLRALEKRVESLLNLPENWDGYGAPRVNWECVMAAFSLILPPNVIHETPAPQFVPTNQGGIQVEWHLDGYDLEVIFDPNEQPRYYHVRADGVEIEGEVAEDPSLVGSLIRALPIRNEFSQPVR